MQLYILRPIRFWSPWYDKAFGFVVRATSESEARKVASEGAGDEGNAVWLDPEKTTCYILNTEGPSEIIIRDFAAA